MKRPTVWLLATAWLLCVQLLSQPTPLLLAFAQSPAQPSTPPPPLVKYITYQSSTRPGDINLRGHFELLAGGKYRMSNNVDKGPYFGEGKYSYDPKTGRLSWLSGFFKDNANNPALKPDTMSGAYRVTDWIKRSPGVIWRGGDNSQQRIHRIFVNRSYHGEYIEYRK